MLNEATEDNLIDLGPGSPAVVTPRITSSPPPHSTAGATATPAHNPTAASLSTALAGLGKSRMVLSLCSRVWKNMYADYTEKKPANLHAHLQNTNYHILSCTFTLVRAESSLLPSLCRPGNGKAAECKKRLIIWLLIGNKP